jgi:hypothetical protein
MIAYRYSARYRTWYRPSRGSVPRPLAIGAAVVVAVAAASSPAQHALHHHHHASAPAMAAPAGGNVALGQQMAAQAGWTGGQWNCLDWLWNRESGWSRTAENPKSGAYGIAQALGHGPTNQYPAGPANPPTSSAPAQIRWGLGYIANTPYGTHTPCQAWAHEQSNGWY